MKRTGLIAIGVVTMVSLWGCQRSAETDTAARSVNETRQSELQATLATRYENPQAHYELGRIYQQQGRHDQAEFRYNVAMGFDPTHRQAQAAMVKLYYDKKDPQRAAITAETYMNQASTSTAGLMALGRSFQRERLDDYALACYQRAQRLSPNSAPVHKQLGYFYMNKGDAVRAETHLRRSFEIDPDQPDVAAELGRMGVRVQVPPRKSTGLLGPLRTAEPDETIK